MIGKISREYLDLNRIQAAQTDFRKSMDSLIEDDGIRRILDIHGKKEPGVDIGTGLGRTCAEDTADLVKTFLSKNFNVTMNAKYQGLKPGSIVTTYEKTDSKGQFLVQACSDRVWIRRTKREEGQGSQRCCRAGGSDECEARLCPTLAYC